MVSEQDITREIIKAINATNAALVWRNHSGMVKVKRAWMHLAPKGTPDIVGVDKMGRFISFEVKLPKEKQTLEQQVWTNTIRNMGGFCAVVHSVEEALGFL